MPETYYTVFTGFYDKHGGLQAMRVQQIVDGRLVERQFYRETDAHYSYKKTVSESVNYLRQPDYRMSFIDKEEMENHAWGVISDPMPQPLTDPAPRFTVDEVTDHLLGIAQNTPPSALIYRHIGVEIEDKWRSGGEHALQFLATDLLTNANMREAAELFRNASNPDAKPSAQPIQKSNTQDIRR